MEDDYYYYDALLSKGNERKSKDGLRSYDLLALLPGGLLFISENYGILARAKQSWNVSMTLPQYMNAGHELILFCFH